MHPVFVVTSVISCTFLVMPIPYISLIYEGLRGKASDSLLHHIARLVHVYKLHINFTLVLGVAITRIIFPKILQWYKQSLVNGYLTIIISTRANMQLIIHVLT